MFFSILDDRNSHAVFTANISMFLFRCFGYWTFPYYVCTANTNVAFLILDNGHSHWFVQRISMMFFRYWLVDISISFYSEYQCCFLDIDIGHSRRFVQRQMLFFRYWVLDIPIGLYSEYQ